MEKLTEIGKALNLDLKSQTLSRESSGFYSLLTMDMNPKHVNIIGIGTNNNCDTLFDCRFVWESDRTEKYHRNMLLCML